MTKIDSITIQSCGGAGDGSVVTGMLIATSLVKMGYHSLIHDTFPAEIRGFGKTLSEVRISTKEVISKADDFDILIALNAPYSIEQIPHMKKDGIIIYDSKPGIEIDKAKYIPNFAKKGMQCYGIPMETTAEKLTGRKLGKNVVAIGFLANLLNLKPEPFLKVLKSLFSKKGEKIVKSNQELFICGYNFNEKKYEKLNLTAPRPHKDEIAIISGNRAMASGALNADLKFFAGYPITPATKIMEYLALELPKNGGIMLQTEDEIAAAGAVAGAWYTGKRAMTATSGPGFSLMSEIINMGVMTETPLVIVNVMRGGPSTGMPTKVEQSDLNIALYGGHGDSPRVVMAASTIKECYSIVQDALDVAQKYQTPVIVLSDKFLAMSNIDVPTKILKRKRKSTRVKYKGAAKDYKRYQFTKTGVSPWVVPGEMDCSYTITGIEHNELGCPDYDLANHKKMAEKRFIKFDNMLKDLPKPEFFGKKGAPNLVITWGSSFGAVKEAVERLEKEGYKIELMNVKTIFPQHKAIIEKALKKAKKIIIPEQNEFGQFAKIMKGFYAEEIDEIHLTSCAPVRPREAYELLKKRLKK